jgi:hypothetical protein
LTQVGTTYHHLKLQLREISTLTMTIKAGQPFSANPPIAEGHGDQESLVHEQAFLHELYPFQHTSTEHLQELLTVSWVNIPAPRFMALTYGSLVASRVFMLARTMFHIMLWYVWGSGLS